MLESRLITGEMQSFITNQQILGTRNMLGIFTTESLRVALQILESHKISLCFVILVLTRL